MNAVKLTEAIDAAKRFISLAQPIVDAGAAAYKRGQENKRQGITRWGYPKESSPLFGTRASGDMQRASMDLTRKLSDARKP